MGRTLRLRRIGSAHAGHFDKHARGHIRSACIGPQIEMPRNGAQQANSGLSRGELPRRGSVVALCIAMRQSPSCRCRLSCFLPCIVSSGVMA